jgi:FkbM family methyltransferase
MSLGKTLKYWSRSGSLQFARDRHQPGELHSVVWNGHPVYYRPGTFDVELIYKGLLRPAARREYRLPEGLAPKVVLDIGANIGVAALMLHEQAPGAEIHCFEPVPANFELLKKNLAPYPRLHAYPVGLGAKSGAFEIAHSDDATNHGGYSLRSPGTNQSLKTEIRVESVAEYLASRGIRRADAIKIDTEGCEYEILTSLDPDFLKQVTWIMGELHGERDFELLGYLSEWFDVAVRKELGSRLGSFEAHNLKR